MEQLRNFQIYWLGACHIIHCSYTSSLCSGGQVQRVYNIIIMVISVYKKHYATLASANYHGPKYYYNILCIIFDWSTCVPRRHSVGRANRLLKVYIERVYKSKTYIRVTCVIYNYMHVYYEHIVSWAIHITVSF